MSEEGRANLRAWIKGAVAGGAVLAGLSVATGGASLALIPLAALVAGGTAFAEREMDEFVRESLAALYTQLLALGEWQSQDLGATLTIASEVRGDHDELKKLGETVLAELDTVMEGITGATEAIAALQSDVAAVAGQALTYAAEALAAQQRMEQEWREQQHLVGFKPLHYALHGGGDHGENLRVEWLLPRLFRPTGPNWADFQAGVPYERLEVGHIIETLAHREHATPIILIEGDAASGKSVIARHVGFKLTGRPVFHADHSTLRRRAGALKDIFETIAAGVQATRREASEENWPRPVFIIEDIHRPSRVHAVDLIEELNTNPPEADFVLVTRPSEDQDKKPISQARDWHPCKMEIVVLRRSRAPGEMGTDLGAIAQHLWRKRWELDKPGEQVPTLDWKLRVPELVRESGGNLWLLTWMIQEHSGEENQPFTRLKAHTEAHKYLYGLGDYEESVAARCGLHDIEGRDREAIPGLILAVSAFSQWETPVARDLVCELLSTRHSGFRDEADVRDAIASLVAHGELVSDDTQGVRLPHSALAEVYLHAEQGEPSEKYVSDRIDGLVAGLPHNQRAAAHAVVKALDWEHYAGVVGRAEGRLLIVAALTQPRLHARLLGGRFPLAAATAKAISTTSDAASRVIKVALFGGMLHGDSLEVHTILGVLRKAVHRQALSSAEIIEVAEALIAEVGEEQRCEIVQKVSWIAPNDSTATSWLLQQWEEGTESRDAEVEERAACALAWRGRAETQHWKSIYRRLCADVPSVDVLAAAHRFPRKAWVRALRRFLRQGVATDLHRFVIWAWAQQSRVFNPERIVKELDGVQDESRIAAILFGGDVLQRIDSPMVVEFILDKVARGVEHRGMLFRGILRCNEIWLPEAVGGFATAGPEVEANVQDVLERLITTDSGNEGIWVTMPQREKKAAQQLAISLQLLELPRWLEACLSDTNFSVAMHAAEMLGWLEAKESTRALIELLQDDSAHEMARQGAARGLGSIGGREAIGALLRWPVMFGDAMALSVCEAVQDAVRDAHDLELLLDYCGHPHDDKPGLPAAAWAICQLVWGDWCHRKETGRGRDYIDPEHVRDRVYAILAAQEPPDELAWAYLVGVVGALPTNEETASLLRRYASSSSEKMKAAAIESAAALNVDLGVDLLAAAKGLEPYSPRGMDLDLNAIGLDAIIESDLVSSGVIVPQTLPCEDQRELASRLLRTGHFEALKVLPQEVVIAEIDDLMQPGRLRGCMHSGVNRAAVLFAHEALAARLERGEWREWYPENVLWFAREMRVLTEEDWQPRQRLWSAALEFLAGAVSHENARVRDTSGACLAELDMQCFGAHMTSMFASDDWRERAAATEAASLLPNGEFELAMRAAQMDVDSRVRELTFWARERRRERSAQDYALGQVENASNVRAAFKWQQTLVHAGDDWGLMEVARIMSGRGTSAAKRNWLRKAHGEVKKSWEKRIKKHDDNVKWDE